jgi:muconolactone delta-isomerase
MRASQPAVVPSCCRRSATLGLAELEEVWRMLVQAVGRVTRPDEIAGHVQEEARVVDELKAEGVLRHLYLRADRGGAFFLLAVDSVADAEEQMARLPFVSRGLLQVAYAEVVPA